MVKVDEKVQQVVNELNNKGMTGIKVSTYDKDLWRFDYTTKPMTPDDEDVVTNRIEMIDSFIESEPTEDIVNQIIMVMKAKIKMLQPVDRLITSRFYDVEDMQERRDSTLSIYPDNSDPDVESESYPGLVPLSLIKGAGYIQPGVTIEDALNLQLSYKGINYLINKACEFEDDPRKFVSWSNNLSDEIQLVKYDDGYVVTSGRRRVLIAKLIAPKDSLIEATVFGSPLD